MMTSKEMVLDVLKSGNELSPQEIGRACHIQHNTAIKDIKFLRDDGHDITKRRVVTDGTEYYRYRLVGVRNDPPPHGGVVVTGQPVQRFLFQADYPCDGVMPDGRQCGSWYRVDGAVVVCNMCGKTDAGRGRIGVAR
jgi:biotin operon repressor